MKNKTLRNMPTVLMVGGVIGVIATSVAVAIASPKAKERLQYEEDNKDEDLTKWETVKTLVPVYGLSVILGVATIGCIVGSNFANKKQIASLSAALAVGGRYVHRYKDKVKELFGDEMDQTIDEEIKVEHPDDTVFTYESWSQILDNSSENNPGTPMLFYDLASGTFFEKTLEQVLLAEYHLNRNYILEGEATLNDWRFYLGLDTTETGNNLVWTQLDEGDEWIDFGHKRKTTDDGREYYEIEIITEPYDINSDQPFK